MRLAEFNLAAVYADCAADAESRAVAERIAVDAGEHSAHVAAHFERIADTFFAAERQAVAA